MRAILLSAAMVMVACTQSEPPQEAPPPAFSQGFGYVENALTPAEGHVHDWSVHWITVPHFEDLMTSADLVVEGRVVSYRPDEIRAYDYVDPKVFKGTPITIVSVQVEDIIHAQREARPVGKGSMVPGAIIEVQDLGGLMDDGCTAHPNDKPLMRRGEKVVLFLSQATVELGLQPANGGRYDVVGGYQGRFHVNNGKVYPLAKTVKAEAGFFRHEGRPVAEFIQELKAQAATSVGVQRKLPQEFMQ
jgi:hypothetical protein